MYIFFASKKLFLIVCENVIITQTKRFYNVNNLKETVSGNVESEIF